MDISNLWTLQVMMFFLVAAGAILKSTGILKGAVFFSALQYHQFFQNGI